VRNDSPGGQSITEGKQVLPEHILEQVISQTIVFSLLQNQRHPEFLNHMVPNIVISPEKVQILMYDAANDVLLCSNLIRLFNHRNELLDQTVVILWMVMHYRVFCSGLEDVNSSVLNQCKSNFQQLVDDKWEIYSHSLKNCVHSFPAVPTPDLDVNFLLDYGVQFKVERESH
jgi:hypothetical protein